MQLGPFQTFVGASPNLHSSRWVAMLWRCEIWKRFIWVSQWMYALIGILLYPNGKEMEQVDTAVLCGVVLFWCCKAWDWVGKDVIIWRLWCPLFGGVYTEENCVVAVKTGTSSLGATDTFPWRRGSDGCMLGSFLLVWRNQWQDPGSDWSWCMSSPGGAVAVRLLFCPSLAARLSLTIGVLDSLRNKLLMPSPFEVVGELWRSLWLVSEGWKRAKRLATG